MPEPDLIDNDIAFKICCYRLNDAFQTLFDGGPKPHRLGLATFVLQRKIERSTRVADKAAAQAHLTSFLEWAPGLEPSEEELALAADIESLAQHQNVDFDTGESLLLAVLLRRSSPRLLTGDKRAIVALGAICNELGRTHEVAGKCVCFEQVLLAILDKCGAKTLVECICREAAVDKAASICCGCASGGSDEAGITEGLQSYIRHLREASGAALAA